MRATIHPQLTPLTGLITPPSSKNYTTRLLLVSALADGHSVILRPAVQDDAVAMVRCLKQFGAEITALDQNGEELEFSVENAAAITRLEVLGFGANPTAPTEPVDPDNAGTVLRFLLGMAALVDGEVTFLTRHYEDSLGKRPNQDLLDALRLMGVEVLTAGEGGSLPITLRGGKDRLAAALAKIRQDQGLAPHEPAPIPVSGAVSSQFLSSLLFLGPLLREPVRFYVSDFLRSQPLIETTRAVMKEAGVEVQSSSDRMIHQLDGEQGYRPRRWEVNGDWPGTSAILAAAAVVPGSEITLVGLQDDEQGERRCLEYYRAIGCKAEWVETKEHGMTLQFASPTGGLKAAAINGNLCTDAVLAMMAAAAVAEGESRFIDITNLQFKECDRVREPIGEIRRILQNTGFTAEEAEQRAYWEPDDEPDIIHITGAPEGYTGGIEVDGLGDHRVIMLLSVLALRCKGGLTITDAHHVAKSFPAWFDTLRTMGVGVEVG